MKVLFLDIDGVLNSHIWFAMREAPSTYQSMFERSKWDLDPRAVALVKDFVQRNNLKVVISSTWRRLYNESQLKALFKEHDWNIPIIGVTPTSRSGIRGDEIQTWIDNWNQEHPSNPVENYIIFDDDSDFKQDQLPHFVQTQFTSGLTRLHVQRAEHILKGSR